MSAVVWANILLTLPFLDPQLPQALLPANWSGSQAAELFHRRHAEWELAARRRWDELTLARRA